jgi:hypothetical protein
MNVLLQYNQTMQLEWPSVSKMYVRDDDREWGISSCDMEAIVCVCLRQTSV